MIDSVKIFPKSLKLAMCNFIEDIDSLKKFAIENGFSGIDWSFNVDELPNSPAGESRWVETIKFLDPLEVRFHCPFIRVDLGHNDTDKVKTAVNLFKRIIRLVSKANGKYLSLHVGLGHDTTRILSWDKTVDNLRRMVQSGAELGIKVCLENLAWGWTSKPQLFEKLIRKTGAGITFDIGHAHACMAVDSQQFSAGDFVTPHPNRVYNAHVYHTEISGVGHLPPENLHDIQDRLDILQETRCNWWVIEIREIEGLLQTRKIIDQYLEQVSRRQQV